MKTTVIPVVMTMALLLTLPAAASDYTLDVFGNANEDDTINMQDVTYTELIILEYRDETELSDAKYDGKINMQDVTQIELVILGKEKELTVLDGNGEAVTVEKPVERIIVLYKDAPELLRILDSEGRIVGVSDYIKEWDTVLFPEISKLPGVGGFISPDYEAVLNLNPDVLLTFGATTDEMKEKLPGVAVIFLGLYRPDLSNPEGSKFTDGVRKLGYIVDKREEAEAYVEWRIGWINEIKSRTEGLTEDEKPRVFHYCSPTNPGYKTYTGGYKASQMSLIAGGANIVESLPEYIQAAKYTMVVDPEWVISQNPDFIVAQLVLESVAHGYGVDDPSEMAALRDDILNRPELANVNAVKSGDVYMMSGNYRNDASGYFIGAAYMAKWFHPELFEDLDPSTIHQEYLTEFQGLDYDLDEHGVFVYPPLEGS